MLAERQSCKLNLPIEPVIRLFLVIDGSNQPNRFKSGSHFDGLR
jgi:hypothetical protein